MFLESPETTGSLIHPKIRVPGFTVKSGFPESPRPSGSRSHMEIRFHGFTGRIQCYRTKFEDSGFPE